MRGILLLNLGSPKSPSEKDVKAFLKEFLMDPEVLDMPFLFRWIVVHFFILPFRPKKTAHAYQQIWNEEGSPLISITQKVVDKLQVKVHDPIEVAMRYQAPSISNAISKLINRTNGQLNHLFVIPMYPQYATSTVKTAIAEVQRCLNKLKVTVKLTIQPPFYGDPDYLHALESAIKPSLEKPFDYVLFSYHGVPERHVKKTDPTGVTCLSKPSCCDYPHDSVKDCYRAHCVQTTQGVVKRLGLKPHQYGISFQSRLGMDPWLQPFTDKVLKELPKKGLRHLAVVCPSFVADCLETLEEVEIRSKADFLSSGGETFQYIPCLNTNKDWILTLEKWCKHAK